MMSDVIQVKLDKWQGYVDTSILPGAGGCNFLCLSDRQVAVIRGFVFPFCRWRTRVVLPLHGDLFQIQPEIAAELAEELDDLELQINGGSTMSCQTIADAIADLATAIAAGGGAAPAECTTNVYCGGGAIAGVAGELAKLPNADLLPPADVEIPEYPTPPEGFENWPEYNEYKCQAAYYVWYQLRALAVANSALAGLQITAAVVAPIIAGLLGAWPVALTPVGFITLIGAMVAVGVINVYAFLAFTEWIAAWDANKENIVCELYTSGSAAAAMSALTGAIEDCIQAVEWTGILEGLAGTVAPLMGTIMSEVVTNSFVSPLFRLVATITISVPEGICAACSGLLGGWHFDYGTEGWTFSQSIPGQPYPYAGVWDDDPFAVNPWDTSVPNLEMDITHLSGDLGIALWTFPGSGLAVPIAHTGDLLAGDSYMAVTGTNARRYMNIAYVGGGSDHDADVTGEGWHNHTVHVTAPNNGKTIASIGILWWANNAYTGLQQVFLDRVEWLPA